MAIKFSQFNLRTDHTSGMYLVGYDGNQNIHITVDNLFDDFINGTENTIAMFGTNGTVLADSIITQSGSSIGVAGAMTVTSDATFSTNIEVEGTADFNGDVNLGDEAGDLITQNGTLYLNGPVKDTTDTLGAVDQVLLSDATGELTFTDLADLHVGGAEVVEVPVKNVQGSALVKGDPVYISGSVGASGRLEVQLADASNTLKMPAVGLLKQDLADQAEGFAVVTGKLRNLITDPIDGVTPTENDVIYVKPSGTSGAALTTTKPVYGNFIQNIGKVGRVSTSNDGNLVVSSILRTNDIPNLTPGRLWIGSTGNTIESQTLFVDEANTRLGIGTALPATSLDVNGDITSRGDIIIDAAIGDPFLKLKTPAQEYVLRIDRSDNEKFQIRDITNSATRVTLDTSGNIGSGTTTPFAKLHIKDEVNNPGILIESSQTTGANFQNSYINLRAQETSTNTNASGSIIMHGANTLNAAGPKTLQIRNLSFGGADVLITTYDNTNTALSPARFKGSGQVQFEEYGSGSFTGTAAKNLSVTSSGDIIETDAYNWDISDGVNLPDTIASGETVTFAGGTELTTTYAASTNTLTIDHDAISRGNSNATRNPGYGGTFTAVDNIVTNATGHVTGVNLLTVTMPSAENYTWTLTADSGTNQTINSGNTVDIAGGTYISTVVGATDTATINHDTTTRTDTTSTDTPGSGGTFTVVDSVTTNATGHLEAINVKTVTMPTATLSGGGTANYISKWSTTSALTDSLIYDTGTQLGIATTSPDSGVILQIGDGTVSEKVRIYDSSNKYIDLFGSGIHFTRNNSYLRPAGAAASQTLYIGDNLGGSNPNRSWGAIRSEFNDFWFTDNGVKVMRIHNENVGIGTGAVYPNSASEKLHVDGNFRLTGSFKDGSNGAGTSGQVLSSTGTSTSWISLPAAYTNADVDAHLNTSTATTNQVLSWDGSDYDWVTSSASNDYVNAASFNTSSGVLTLTRTDSGTVTVDLDGRFLTGNQTITLSGDVTGSGTTSISTSISSNVVGANELNVSGNGTSGQVLTSDGDGTFSWSTPTTGDITGVTAGTGLSGGGSSGNVTLNLDFSELTDKTSNISGTTEFIIQDGTTESRKAASEIQLSHFNNNAGWTSNIGDITAVNAGTNLTGGGTSGSVTLNMATGGIGAGTYGSTSNDNKIDQITVDAYGRVTAITTGATGAGSMSSWIIKEGNGTETATVTNGETVTIEDGTGIQSELTSTSSGGTITITNTSPNVSTNLSTSTTTTSVTVNSSDGTNATIGEATGSAAGVMSTAHHNKLDGIAAGATNVTNNNQLTNGAGYITGYTETDTLSSVVSRGSSTGSRITTAGLTATSDIRGNGQQLVLNAGESFSYATGQTGEHVYLNAEGGVQIVSSPNNWSSGWAGRRTAVINDSSGNSSLPGNLTTTGDITVSGGDIYINDTNTRLTEGGSNSLKVQTNSGYIELGPKNTSHCHIETDRGNFYFNKQLIVNTGIVRSYDEDLNLNRAGSTTARLRLTSGTTHSDQNFQVNGASTSDGAILDLQSNHTSGYNDSRITFSSSDGDPDGTIIYKNEPFKTRFELHTQSTGTSGTPSLSVDQSSAYFSNKVYAQEFIDRNATSYKIHPGGTDSRLNYLKVGSTYSWTTNSEFLSVGTSTGNLKPLFRTMAQNSYPTWNVGWEHDTVMNSTYGDAARFKLAGSLKGYIRVNSSSVTYSTSSSDERLKKNIETWDEDLLSKFEAIEPKKFHFNYQEDSDEKIKGYVAQQMIDKFPEAYPLSPVDESGEEYYSFDPSAMAVYLMKAVKDLVQENKQLKQRVEALENA